MQRLLIPGMNLIAPTPQRKLVLVSCSKGKLTHPAPAKDLYQSPLFELSRRYAESLWLPWMILSAEFGLVHPERILPPYDVTIKKAGADPAWVERVQAQLRETWAGCVLLSLCPVIYETALVGWEVARPLHGLGIGKRLQWLKQHWGVKETFDFRLLTAADVQSNKTKTMTKTKQLATTLAALSLALTGCSTKFMTLGRAWPDGASVTMKGVQVTVSMTGAGSFTAQEISWVGTNGYPLAEVSTNKVRMAQ